MNYLPRAPTDLELLGTAGYALLGVAALLWVFAAIDHVLARFEREDEP